MEALFTYIWQSALVLTVLFVPFQLLLRKERFFALNRAILLSILVVSLILPLSCHSLPECFSFLQYQGRAMSDTPYLDLGKAEVGEVMIVANHDVYHVTSAWLSSHWKQMLLAIWVIGTVVFMVWQSMGIRLLCKILNDKTNVRERLPEGNTLLLTSATIPSFSWMRSIVVSVDDYAENGDTILAHERAHIAHRHSLDHLLLLLIQCVQWWNPFLWLLADSLIEVHEYQADMAVLEQGINATQYQLLLIRKAAGPAGIAMVNGFKRNKLKHRIIMMNKTFSLRGAKCRYLALLPMILIAFACTSKVETLEEPSLTNNETLQEDPNLTNATQVTLLVNSAGHIMMVAPGFDAVVVSIEELPEKLGKMDIVNAVVTIKADKDTPMPVITDIKNSLRKLFLNRINYQLYEDSDGK